MLNLLLAFQKKTNILIPQNPGNMLKFIADNIYNHEKVIFQYSREKKYLILLLS